MQIEHNRNKKKNLEEATSWLFTSVAWDLNLGQPRTNPASGQSGTRTSGLPDWESDAKTTWPRCFPSKGTRGVGGGGERGVKVKGKEGQV